MTLLAAGKAPAKLWAEFTHATRLGPTMPYGLGFRIEGLGFRV